MQEVYFKVNFYLGKVSLKKIKLFPYSYFKLGI